MGFGSMMPVPANVEMLGFRVEGLGFRVWGCGPDRIFGSQDRIGCVCVSGKV